MLAVDACYQGVAEHRLSLAGDGSGVPFVTALPRFQSRVGQQGTASLTEYRRSAGRPTAENHFKPRDNVGNKDKHSDRQNCGEGAETNPAADATLTPAADAVLMAPAAAPEKRLKF